MSSSLLELVENMSGNFNSIECKSCTENNRCEQCKKLIEGLIKKFPSVFWCYEKVFFPMNIWIAGKNLMKTHYHLILFKKDRSKIKIINRLWHAINDWKRD